MFLGLFSSPPPPSGLSLEDILNLANEQLENARKSNDPTKKSQFCKDAKSKLKDAEKIFAATRVGHPTQDNGIANAYYEHGILLTNLGQHFSAKRSHKKAKGWGYVYKESLQTGSPQPSNNTGSIHQSLCPTAAFIVAPGVAAAMHQDVLNLDIAQPIVQSHSQEVISVTADHPLEPSVDTVAISQKIFLQDVVLSHSRYPLPDSSGRITSTPQLAYCLSLSLPSLVSKESLNETEFKWSQAKVNDSDEQERMQIMATDVIRAFIRDELKKPDAIAEAVCLAAVLDKDDFRKLLQVFVNGIEQSVLLELHLLDGLAHLIGNAAPECIDADDLVKILMLLSTRLQDTHQQSGQHVYRLAHTVSRALDSMVNSQVKDLKREQLHEPLSAYLKELQESSDHSLVYQSMYAHQALQYIPDDETILQAALRRTGKVVQGVSGVVSAVKALDLNGFIRGLQELHTGLNDVGNAIVAINDTYQRTMTLAENGQALLESLKEGLSYRSKRAWYPALRGLDLLLKEGRLVEFETLVREAPCRQDPTFQLGVCQRLEELSANTLWDTNTRQCAISFLGEMYRDDVTWSRQANVKQWILYILTQLSDSSDNMVASHSRKQLQELEVDRSLVQVHTEPYSGSFSMRTILPPQTSSLFDRVINKPDVETDLLRLKSERLKERGQDIYISPRAKVSKASNDDFDLSSKAQDFLSSKKKVFLLLGDSGAGKSTFNRELEISLWDKYKKNGRIPIFIHLPSIDKPEQDLITKQLLKSNFADDQIRELKANREFILICDGYDESQQTQNLYMSNQLNQAGSWQAQMVISCRTEYTGVDYKDLFQPNDRNSEKSLELMDEMIITPFNTSQIQAYIDQYVASMQTSWESKDYAHALKQIPNLQDLVKNPFLLKMALGVLPTLANTGSDFSNIRITRVELYDKFVSQWLERNKIRIGVMNLSNQDKEALRGLTDSGFKQRGVKYLKELATAIYDNQDGNPIVKYTSHNDQGTWKEPFFNNVNGNNLLKEAIPLSRNSDQYRFIHKSVLEYGLALAVYDPDVQPEDMNLTPILSRRGSTSSTESFEVKNSTEKTTAAVEQPLLKSPLGRRNLVNEPSILQFLAERVQQQPLFKAQLHAIIHLSKSDKAVRIAAANSITVLVQARVQFNGADLRGIKIPGANLSYGVFDSAQLEGADLRKTNLRTVWLRQANLSGARMGGVQFGELPYLQEDAVVTTCAYSPDGKTFAVGLENGNIHLYDTVDWSRSQTSMAHSRSVISIIFSPQGNRIASGSLDSTVRLWDVETGDCVNTLQGHDRYVRSVAYSPKGDQIASGSDDKTIRLWDVETGNCVKTLQGHGGWVMSVAYSPKGDQIASGSEDKTIRLWDVETGNCINTLQGHDDYVRSVAYSPKGYQIASGSEDKTIRLWGVETGYCVNTLQGHGGYVTSVAYSPKGDQIVSGSHEKTIRLWDVEAGDCVNTLQGHGDWVMSVVYSPKGDQIASGGDDKTVRLWDMVTGNGGHIVQGHNSRVWSVVYSPNGDRIASGSSDKTVRAWNVETGNCINILLGHDANAMSVVFSSKGDQIASGSVDKTIRLWDVETGDCVNTLQGHGDYVRSVAYSPKGDQIASGSDDKTIRLWDIETGNCVNTLKGHGSWVRSVAYSPKGDQIASGSDDETVRLWDVETGNCVNTLQGHSDYVMSVVYSPKGDQIASGSKDKTIRLWDVETGNSVHTLHGHSNTINSVVYSSKGDQIASGSDGGTVRLWDVETGECLLLIDGFNGDVESVSWRNDFDHQYIVTGCQDGSVRQWRIVKEESGYKALLIWSSSQVVLSVSGVCLDGVQGLSAMNQNLLHQRGALKSPSISPVQDSH